MFRILNKAIIETEFVKDYPQYVNEMKEAIKFKNIGQKEAEERVARKYRLPILQKLTGKGGFGSWSKTLKKDKEEKMAGAVMSTTAGIESKPRYSKKKNDEDEE